MNRPKTHTDSHGAAAVEDQGIARTLTRSFISGALTGIAATVIMAICSLIAVSKDDPSKIISVCGIAIPAVSYFIGGYISGRLSRRAPIVCGIITSASIMILLKALAIILKAGSSSHSAAVGIMLCIAYAFLSIIGAITASNLSLGSKKKSKKRSPSRK